MNLTAKESPQKCIIVDWTGPFWAIVSGYQMVCWALESVVGWVVGVPASTLPATT